MIRLSNIELSTHHLYTRMPFRFGIATLTEVEHCFVKVEAEIDGTCVEGLAAEHLFPKWFTKNPETTFEEEVAEITRVVQHAVSLAQDIEAETVFAFWKTLYDHQLSWAEAENIEPLLSQFGPTLIERALIDAFAKYKGTTVHALIRDNSLGIDLSLASPKLADFSPADLLPDAPLDTVMARHTVGLTDPLTRDAVLAEDKVDDGLPQSLEDCIDAYQLKHFKLKVCGQLDKDIPRLREIAEVIEKNAPSDYAFSLDGNEQFYTCQDFHDFWNKILDDSQLKRFFEHVLFIEQPLNRKVALSDAAADMKNWKELPPVIIDESDATLESLPRALELGYSGTSHKNCKGVCRGILNRCLINYLNKTEETDRYVMSGEDLVNIGPVGLLQDLTIQATLGNESIERNGHHYISGLRDFPEEVHRLTLEHHGDLYHAVEGGWPSLKIENGCLDLTSINRAPFGHGYHFPTELFKPVANR